MLRPILNQSAAKALEFFKMSGGGNDFVVLDHRAGGVPDPTEFTRRICTRRLSVGADGVILVEPSTRATFKMRYFNADGSEAEFCANGTRCAARFAFLNVIAPRRMTIETAAGVIAAEVHDHDVTLTLPPPRELVPDRPLEVSGGRTIRGSSIRVGVPHYVIYLKEALWEQPIDALGRELRWHPELQPDGANINFVVVRDRGSIEVRTWERGVEAETFACGSGVVATVSISALFGRVDSPVSVLTRSGIRFRVAFTRAPDGFIDEIRLTGDARVIYRAPLSAETIEGFDPDWARDPVSVLQVRGR